MTSIHIDPTARPPAPSHGSHQVVWLCAVLIAGLAAGTALAAQPVTGVRWGVAVLVLGFYAAGELRPVEIEFRNETHAFSFTSVPLVIGLLLLPMPIVMAARTLSSLVVLGGVHRQEPLKLLVNTTSHALEVLIAGQIMVWVGGTASFGPRAWLATGLAVIAADLAGAVIVTTAISLFQQEWDHSFLTGIWIPLVVALVDSSFALMIANQLHHGAVNVWLAVPTGVFLVGQTHRFARVTARYKGMIRLDTFARDLAREALSADFDALLLNRMAEVMHADQAWLWRPGEPKLVYSARDSERPRPDKPTPFDVACCTQLSSGAHLLNGRSPLVSQLNLEHSEAIVCVLKIADGGQVLLGVGERSGATREFDNEDVVLFDILCAHAAVSLRNVSLLDELRTESASLEFQATHDPLTGLPNRSLFMRHIDQAGQHGTTFAVLLLDLDRFKEVNDTLGHACGDSLLVEVGCRLKPLLLPGELLARLGGDEFVLCIDAPTEQAAIERARVILLELRRPFAVSAVEVDVDASIGIALPSDGSNSTDGDDLLRRADVAMYSAKNAHTGVEIYAADRDDYSPKRLAVAARLRTAIEQGGINLHYQPQINLATGHVEAVEALARWHDPSRGNVPPAEFIEVAERTELIHPLTRHVLQTAIDQASRWQQAGRPLRIAVNISARNLTEPNLVRTIGDLLNAHRLPPTLLEVELTETTIMANPTLATSVIGHLRDMGIRIAVDDFGTGHSSLAYLSTLAVDQLKIDRSFVHNMTTDPTAETIVKAIVDLGRNLHLDVVAEGVETTAIENSLRQMRCTYAQGYLFSRPVPAAVLSQWLAAHQPIPEPAH